MNINFSLGNLNRLAEDYMRRNATVTPAPVAPRPAPVAAPVAPTPTPVEYSSLNNPFLDYRDTLSGGANYASINDVDNVDDFYDDSFQKAFADTGYLLDSDIIGGEGGIGGGQVDYSPTRILSEQEYRGFVGDTPAYLSDFGNNVTTVDKTVQAYSAVKDLSSTEELASALSSYYGYDVTASEQSFSKADFGGNLGEHTNSSDSELQQFHSLVEPILKDQVSYLQATKGLSYQDALMQSYNSDPMLQALYHKYDVSPVRQTKDGSTYLYDPFSFSEIRTTEVKDPSVKDIAVDVAKAWAISSVLGPIAGSIVEGANLTLYAKTGASLSNTITTTAASMATSATVATVLGGDPLQAAMVAGIPIGRIVIPGTNGMTIDKFVTNKTNLNTGQFQLVYGATPMGTAMAAVEAMGIPMGSGGGPTGVGPDFNPYINNIAASVAGTTIEEEEERFDIDLANLAALSQQEDAPVTPVTPPPLAPEPVAVPVEPIEQPELPLDIAPPLSQDSEAGSATSSPTSVESGSSGEIEGDVVDPNTNIIYRQLIEAANQEEDGSALKDALLAEAERYRMEPEIYESDALLGPSSRPWDVDPENWVDNVVTFLYSDLSSSTPPSIGGESLDITGGTDSEVSTDGTTTGDDALDGDGSGNGTGRGTGAGVGEGLGMLAAAGAAGKPTVTDLVFSDYVKRYEAPELQERALPLQGYQAPQGLFRGLV